MRQYVYVMFISNNHASVKAKSDKYQKVSKYYENDCRLLLWILNLIFVFYFFNVKKLHLETTFVADVIKPNIESLWELNYSR